MFEPQNVKSILVAVNYNYFSTYEFENKLKENDLINKYELEKVEASLFFDSPFSPPEQVINNIKTFMPLEYRAKETSIKVVYDQQTVKLVIEQDNYDCSKNKKLTYHNLSKELIDLKLSDINAIGMNFSAEYNLGNTRLSLLNDNIIDKIPDFQLNKTFEFVLPLEYKERNLTETYRIKKIKGGDNSGEDRIYEISANFHFSFSKLSLEEKFGKVKELLSEEIYNEFQQKAQSILELNNNGQNS